jgi:hypothetical protein
LVPRIGSDTVSKHTHWQWIVRAIFIFVKFIRLVEEAKARSESADNFSAAKLRDDLPAAAAVRRWHVRQLIPSVVGRSCRA